MERGGMERGATNKKRIRLRKASGKRVATHFERMERGGRIKKRSN
jgi:hypothetical protein